MTPKAVEANPRELIEAATPLPWRVENADDGYWSVKATGDGQRHAIHTHITTFPVEGEARLAVWAVNNLPALLDVAEALERLLDFIPYTDAVYTVREARAALAHLRGEDR